VNAVVGVACARAHIVAGAATRLVVDSRTANRVFVFPYFRVERQRQRIEFWFWVIVAGIP
jgi:hypothetical protein